MHAFSIHETKQKKGALPTAGLQKGEEKANQITFALAFTFQTVIAQKRLHSLTLNSFKYFVIFDCNIRFS